MLTCKQVSNALSREDYEKLSPMRKFFLKLHVKLCIFCGKFNRQVMDNQDMCRCYRQKEETDTSALNRPGLDPARRDELRALLLAQSRSETEEKGL